MPELRRIVDDLLPPEREAFWPGFWQDVERRERRAAKRWRLTALALAAALVTSLAATGVVAAPFRHAKIVERVVECATQEAGNRDTLDVATVATRGAAMSAKSGRPEEAQLLVTTGGEADYGTHLLQVDGALKGYLLNSSRCASSHDTAPPARRGLPLVGLLRPHTLYGHDYRCLVKAVRVRARLVLAANGVPSGARVEVESLSKRPLIYVDWTPGLVRVYLSPSCETTDLGF
jgi:hypothetical protein